MNIDVNKYTVYGDSSDDENAKYMYIGFKKYDATENDIVNKGIVLVTKSNYIHTEMIYFENGELIMLSASQTTNSIRKKIHKLDKGWDYYRMKVDNSFINNMLKFFNMVKYSKYDYAGILGFILLTRDRSDKWFCSEFCSNVLKINGHEGMWLIEPSSVSPGELANILGIPNKINRLDFIKNMFK